MEQIEATKNEEDLNPQNDWCPNHLGTNLRKI